MELVFSIVMREHLFHNLPQVRARQQAFAVTFIEPFFPAIGKAAVVFLLGRVVPRFGMRLQPRGPVRRPTAGLDPREFESAVRQVTK